MLATWLEALKEVAVWLAALSVVTLVISAILLPAVIWRLPEDYFVRERLPAPSDARGRLLRLLRNVLGLLFILAGVAMLVLPGQGLLTILIGLMFMDFPRKHRIERWIARRTPALKPLNWIRRKGEKPPLRPPSCPKRDEAPKDS